MHFSVVVPNRNGGSLLRTCVRSVLAQSFPHFELILLDNASTDGSAQWVRSLDDTRIQVHSSEQALSIEESWARISALPKAPYLTIIGADDLFDVDFLAAMAALIDASPGAALFQSHFRLVDFGGELLRSCRPVPREEDGPSFLRARLRRQRDSFGTGYVMRSEDYDAVGGFPPFPGLLFADDALWVRLLHFGRKVTAPEELFSYRLHSASASGSPRGTLLLTALARYHEFLDDLARSDPGIASVVADDLPTFVREEVENWYLGQLMRASREGKRGVRPRAARRALADIHPALERELSVLRRTNIALRAHEVVNTLPPLRTLYAWRKQAVGDELTEYGGTGERGSR